MASVGTVVIEVDANTAKLIDGVKKSRKQISSLQKSTAKAKKDIANFAKAVVGVYAMAKAFEAVKNAVYSFTQTAAQFEQFETTLKSITGSSKIAKESMMWITDFTSQTPFQLEQVTSAFVKMKAYGIDPTKGTLRTLGDTASAMGKDINQAVEAMADAITGENERLKEFGIKAKKNGEEITYAWSDSSGAAREIVIDNNKAMIESTLNAIFNEKYIGAMDAQSKTWNGMISNMKDEWTLFQKDVMDQGLFDYLKAVLMTVKDMFAATFGKGKEGAKAFGESVMNAIKSSIETFGWLSDAIDGIKLAFKAVEYAVLLMSKVIMEAINSPITLLNEMIDMYNTVVSVLGGTPVAVKIEPFIDTTWTDSTMATLKEEMGAIVTSLANQEGVNAAREMITKIDANLIKLTATEKENTAAKREAQDVLAGLNATYVETGLVTGMATDAEVKKIYADELATYGLDAQGDALENVNKQLAESSSHFDDARSSVEDYTNSINSLSQTLSASEQQSGSTGVYKTVITQPGEYVDKTFYDHWAGFLTGGFASGGYTGNIPTDKIAGVVHGQENVINAQDSKALGLNGTVGIFQEISKKLDSLAHLYEINLNTKRSLKVGKRTKNILAGA